MTRMRHRTSNHEHAGPKPRARRLKPVSDERGVALIVALLVMVLLSALGLSLTMVTSTEERIAASYRDGGEAFYAADAAFERVVQELTLVPDWNRVLDGSVTSSFVDAQASIGRWPDPSARTPAEATELLRCGKTVCTAADLAARTPERPWGANNPRWQLFAWGPVANMGASGTVNSRIYLAAWVADDPSENDGNPLVDGDSSAGANPGLGMLAVLVHAYGPTGVRRVIEATVARTGTGVRVLSWRELR